MFKQAKSAANNTEALSAYFASASADDDHALALALGEHSVDAQSGKLSGVVVAKQGEALGHGIWLDEDFISGVAAQGNAAGEAGIIVRFGHGDSNGQRIKDYMGKAVNFRTETRPDHDGADAPAVIADIELSHTASELGDNVAWVLGLASERPDALAMSIHFSIAGYRFKLKNGDVAEWRYDREEPVSVYTWYVAKMSDSADGRLYALLGELRGVDFVAEGAATDGLFARKAEAEKSAAADMPTEADGSEPADEFSPPPAAADESALETLREKIRAEFEAQADAAANARFAALQSAHDKKISQLEHERDDALARLESVQAEATSAKARVEKLEAGLAKLRDQLAASQSAFEQQKERYARDVGRALTPPEEAFEGDVREALAKLPPSKRAAFYRKHAAEIDGKKKTNKKD